MQNAKNKTLLVGWDAADWQIIHPLLQQGKMPGLARLMQRAAWGNLVTLDPPISPMLWTSIATGKRPYKHGICGFTELSPDKKTVRPVRVSSRKCPALWNVLNQADIKTNVVGWWPSHPAEPLNGVCVSNFYGVINNSKDADWPMLPNTVFPEKLANELAELRVHPAELTPQIMANFFPDADFLDAAEDEVLRSCMRILAHAASIQAAATHVMETTEWEFQAVYFDALDHFSHLGMKYHPPKLPNIPEEKFKKYHYIVEAAYRFHDMMLERLLDLAGQDCNVFLVSDHGFINDKNRLVKLPDQPGAPALEHRPYGIFVAAGPNITPQRVYGASLLDVAPTILAQFGQPIARDLDGNVLQIFSKTLQIQQVDAYAQTTPSKLESDDAGIDQAVLQSLVEMGYVASGATKNKPMKVLVENEFYRARSLADGGEFAQALQIVETLLVNHADNQRYADFYATLLLRTGQTERLQLWLQLQPERAFVTYLNGICLLQQNKPKRALEAFDKIKEHANDGLLLQIARAWHQIGDENQAKKSAFAALVKNEENTGVLNFIGDLYTAENDYEKALSSYFKSLNLLYYQPHIHEKIGQCLYWLKEPKHAANAFEVALKLMPGNQSVKQQLINLYSEEKFNNDRLQKLQKNTPNPGIVVSGFPRSGTSMMMQVLAAAGIPIFTDAKRKPDQHNPNGYFELEAVKNTTINQDFVKQLGGKAVKIVTPLLRMIQPSVPLKVIWMQRELPEVLASQHKMRGKTSVTIPYAEVKQLQQEHALQQIWLNKYPHVEYITIDYKKTLDNPERTIAQVAKFIGCELNIDAMAAAIKTDKS